MTVHQRTEWEARPPKHPGTPFDGRLAGIAVHWNGPAVDAPPAQLLRSDQNFHMDSRGWDDIAYNLAVDPAGEVWIARGLTVRSAANGDQGLNSTWGAVLCMIGQGQQPTDAMLAGVQDAVDLFARANGLKAPTVTTHHDVYAAGTECPGPDLLTFVHAGLPLPTAPQPQETDMRNLFYAKRPDYPQVYLVGIGMEPSPVTSFAGAEFVAALAGDVRIVAGPTDANSKDVQDGTGEIRKVWVLDAAGAKLFRLPTPE